MSYQFTISDIGLRLIKAYEGYRAEPRTLASGGRVIGFGHSVGADDISALSEEDAEAALKADLAPIEDLINSHVHASMTQSQFDALCSLAFSIGEEAFMSSNILHAMNQGQIIEAANGFDLWRKGNINGKIYVVDALVRRRTAEKALFLRPTQRTARAPRYELTAIKDTDLPEIKGVVELAATAPEFEAATLQNINVIEDEDAPVEDFSDPFPVSEGSLYDDSDTTRRELGAAPVAVLYDNEPLDTPVSETAFDTPIIDLIEDDVFELNVVAAPPTGALSETFPQTAPTVANDIELVSTVEETVVSALEEEILTANDVEDMSTHVDNAVEQVEAEPDTHDTSEDMSETSPIAAAAAEVSDRLDALIDEPVETEPQQAWPDSLITSSIQPEAEPTVDMAPTATETPADVIIDELQQDDALREQEVRESQFNTDKYVEYTTSSDPKPQGGLWAFFTMMIVGLTLLLAGLGINLSGSRAVFGENGPFITVAAMAIGFLLLIGGGWYLIKALFFKD